MSYLEEIYHYGHDIQDLEMSPFETINALHLRSEIEQKYDELTVSEKQQLAVYDRILLSNAKAMYEHLRRGYNFPSHKPVGEWWWHLDKVVNGEIVFNASEIKNNTLNVNK